ncbi:hypothetical protein [Hymenobacter cavernae]|uniref:Uncharacterized protein n=1 Tax=Hymenobacter cavernae TaxID=2044852 RepID=A0ABQ1TSZ3_9BACT|nr:hypothetical protein [Hymenobacter cavernae]GGF02660.1 hypothetical protein GCM10011383_11930 [Hymenobacter cavernae]
MLLKQLLLPSALLVLPLTLSAQTTTTGTDNPAYSAAVATTARDSLFRQASLVRQQIEQQSVQRPTKAPRNGAYRILAKGYYLPGAKTKGSSKLAWKHKLIYRFDGTRTELYTAYLEDGKVTLQERRHNGELTWLRLQSYQTPSNLILSIPTSRASGTYAARNYVWWSGKSYLLPNRLAKP